MNQKEATVSTILAVLATREIEYEIGGEVRVSEILTDTDKATVRGELFNMFRDGEVSFKAEFQSKVDDDSELKKYISGLVNNWVRKEKGFNCNEVYKAKNPGSRKHSGDEQLKALKQLSNDHQGDIEVQAEIQEAIDKRKNEIEAEKPSAKIDVEALPEHLKHLV